MIDEKTKETIKQAMLDHADDFWGNTLEGDPDTSNIYLLEDIYEALEKAGYEIRLVKTEDKEYEEVKVEAFSFLDWLTRDSKDPDYTKLWLENNAQKMLSNFLSAQKLPTQYVERLVNEFKEKFKGE